MRAVRSSAEGTGVAGRDIRGFGHKRSPSSLYGLGRHLMPTLLMTGRRLSNGSLAQLDTDRHELFTVPSQADSLEADEATISWTAAVVP